MGLQGHGVDRTKSEWWRGVPETFYHWQPMPTPLATRSRPTPVLRRRRPVAVRRAPLLLGHLRAATRSRALAGWIARRATTASSASSPPSSAPALLDDWALLPPPTAPSSRRCPLAHRGRRGPPRGGPRRPRRDRLPVALPRRVLRRRQLLRAPPGAATYRRSRPVLLVALAASAPPARAPAATTASRASSRVPPSSAPARGAGERRRTPPGTGAGAAQVRRRPEDGDAATRASRRRGAAPGLLAVGAAPGLVRAPPAPPRPLLLLRRPGTSTPRPSPMSSTTSRPASPGGSSSTSPPPSAAAADVTGLFAAVPDDPAATSRRRSSDASSAPSRRARRRDRLARRGTTAPARPKACGDRPRPRHRAGLARGPPRTALSAVAACAALSLAAGRGSKPPGEAGRYIPVLAGGGSAHLVGTAAVVDAVQTLPLSFAWQLPIDDRVRPTAPCSPFGLRARRGAGPLPQSGRRRAWSLPRGDPMAWPRSSSWPSSVRRHGLGGLLRAQAAQGRRAR